MQGLDGHLVQDLGGEAFHEEGLRRIGVKSAALQVKDSVFSDRAGGGSVPALSSSAYISSAGLLSTSASAESSRFLSSW
jgi:hypothetical protein